MKTRLAKTIVATLFLCAFASLTGFIAGYYPYEAFSVPWVVFIASHLLTLSAYGEVRRQAR